MAKQARSPHEESGALWREKRTYREETEIAPERFEQFGPPVYEFTVTRRDAMRSLGAGILLAITLPLPAQEEDGDGPGAKLKEISARYLFEPEGRITAFSGKVELGQGLRTLITQAVAEEFFVSPEQIALVLGDTGRTPDDGGTWASLTAPQTVPAVRATAAYARTLFLHVAAEKWSAAADSLRLENGIVRGAGTQQLTLFEAAALAKERPASAASQPRPVPPADWRVLGTSLPAINGRDIVTGKQKYAGDLSVPGMLHGAMLRGPYYETSVDRLRAEPRLPEGVKLVHDGDFLGVVGPDPVIARTAAESMRVRWNADLLVEEAKLLDHFRETAKEPVYQEGARYPAIIEKGDAYNGYFAAPRKLSGTYTTAYIAHVPLETSSAIASWEGDQLTVRYSGQAPFLAKSQLAKAFGIAAENVRMMAFETGSGFGGKQGARVAIEAAKLAKEAGAPVKLSYTREDEFQANYFRPAALIDVRSGANPEGQILAFDFHNYNSGASGLAIPYNFPHYYCGYHAANSPLRQGSYRALAAVANTFAREMHMDECAASLREDPIAFRLRHIDDARLREAVQTGAAKFGWGKGAGRPGTAQGMACTLEKDARLVLFVELQARGADVKLLRALMVFDPGAVLNPDNLRNQIAGNIIQATGPALYERISWDDGRLRTRKLSQYRVPRFSDVPELEVELIDRREISAAGAGEAPNTVVAPAIAAAIQKVTGHWVRSLPLLPALAEIISGRRPNLDARKPAE